MPENLYAFFYKPSPPLPLAPSGWSVYDAKSEFSRQGVGSRTKGWRFSDVNAGYGVSGKRASRERCHRLCLHGRLQFCTTYPSLVCVPSRIPDSTIRHASKYRSKERIPALTYLHWANMATITRSSQPLVGLNNRSMQDEKLIEAIFTSHLFAEPNSATAQAAISASRNNTSTGHPATDRGNVVAIYGATTTNLIIDARPTTNAMANRAKGAGTENMEHYKGCKKVYLGVDNIHVMRDSLQKVTDALRSSEPPSTFGMRTVAAEQTGLDSEQAQTSVIVDRDAVPLDHIALKRSSWLKHISALLEGTVIIARNIHINNSHVLIHCSDGWDRTSQLAALAEICLDPYYRTMRGFAVLVEKDWCSFGHRFWDRCGHASSEKYFQTAHGYGEEGSEEESGEETSGGGGFEPQAAANAFWGFTKQLTANFQSSGEGTSSHGRTGAHLKEISPVFHQFLDCIWQLLRQFPARFEFNEQWLLDLYDAVYECKYGTFLYNCESERNGLSDVGMKAAASTRTISVWDAMLDDTRSQVYSNASYNPGLDKDAKRIGADMGVLLPNSKDVGFWGAMFRREGNEMNMLVKAEAEERKRQVEALAAIERQRLDFDVVSNAERSDDRASPLGPAEVDGPTVRGPEEEEVRRNGVVDLTKPLSYQPYQPRHRPSQQRASSQSSLPTAPPTPSRALPGIDDSLSPVEEGSLNPQEAAARMKNLFLGWGARFQDAYANATAPIVDEQQSFSPQRPLPPLSTGNTPPSIHSGARQRDEGITRHADKTKESNPWAAAHPTTKSELGIGELADELPLHIDDAARHPSLGLRDDVAGSEQEKSEKARASYDPLGVGGL